MLIVDNIGNHAKHADTFCGQSANSSLVVKTPGKKQSAENVILGQCDVALSTVRLL